MELDSTAITIIGLLGGLILMLFLMTMVSSRFHAAEKRKQALLGVEKSTLRRVQQKYGQLIDECGKRYRPIYEAQMKLLGKALAGSGSPMTAVAQGFDQTITGEPLQAHTTYFGTLDEVMRAYLEMTAEERQAIRYVASNSYPLLCGYQYSSAAVLKHTRDKTWLRLGLAAASIENCQSDFRDSMMNLNNLLEAAEAAGIDWRSEVITIGHLSDDTRPTGGGGPWESTMKYFQAVARRPL